MAGDIALAQGAAGVVIAGGLGARLAAQLGRSNFGTRFIGKGRFETLMSRLPVKVIADPDAGLFGAAVAFLKEHGEARARGT